MGEGGDAAATVAAHGGFVAVGVVVAHKEVRPGGVVGERHEAVGTDAEAAVAEVGYLLGSELEVLPAGVDKDEVVAGTVEFIEVEFQFLISRLLVTRTRMEQMQMEQKMTA